MSQGHDELDRVIDDVAREMMSADVSADLRARVVARLSDQRAGRSVFAARWVWGGACGAAALIAVGVLLFRPSGHPASPAAAPVQVAASTAPTAPLIGRGDERTAATPPAATTPVRRRRVQRGPDPEPGLAWDAGPEPLAHPEPIAIGTLAPSALAVPTFDVAPLDDIQPITIPAAGPSLPEPQRREPR